MSDPADGESLADWDDHLTLAFREAAVLVGADRLDEAVGLLRATANSARVGVSGKRGGVERLPTEWVASLLGRVRLLGEAVDCLKTARRRADAGDPQEATRMTVQAGELIKDSRGDGADPRVLAYWTVVADAADELRLTLAARIVGAAP